ncbi:MAG TPA: histidine kinase dimerization/phosphoacceptor domain -containing protein [Spirochaetia bacterium]|nr:histidine kinase dimerization/phosphoacceptor domain -containing protein [Spirochaetia bacterium]
MIANTLHEVEPFRAWREELLERTLLIGAVLGVVALVPGLVAAGREGSLPIVIADIAAYGLWLVLFFGKRMAYQLRASLLVVMVLSLGVLLLFAVGLEGASFVWLTAPVLLAALFLSPRLALLTGALVALALAICTVMLLTGALAWERPLWIWASVVGSYFTVATFVSAAMIFLHSRMEKAISAEHARNLEREVLISEIHHRVKNNLQTMVSLLRIQTQTSDDDAVRGALAHAELRVVSMAVAHQLAYQEEHYGTVPADEIVRQVATECARVAGTPVDPLVHGDGARIASEMAAPFALVLAETIALVLNGDDRLGNALEIVTRNLDGHFIVSLARRAESSPASLPDDFQIIQALCDQLGGRFQTDVSEAVLLELTVPAVYN